MGRTFTLDFKLEAVNYAEINGVKKAARKFDVDPKSIREWRFLKSSTTQSQSESEIAHHSINLDFKLNAIKYAKENGIEAAAKEFNVNPEGIQEWCNGRYLKGALKRVPLNKNLTQCKEKSLINVDSKCVRENIENRLVLWIKEQQKYNVVVSKPMIKVKALELFKSAHSRENFEINLNWVQEFLVRKRLNLSCSKVFSSKFKLKVVKHAGKNGILTAAKEYNVSPKYVRKWYNECNLNAIKTTENPPARHRVQRAFTLDFKLNAVKYAKENGISAAAKMYNVDRKSIFEWCSGRKLNALKLKTQTKSKDGKKCMDVVNEKVENLLALWIIDQQKRNVLVTRKIIKVKACELFKSEQEENFQASFAWIKGFLKRNKINLEKNVSTSVQNVKFKSSTSGESSSSINMMEQDSESSHSLIIMEPNSDESSHSLIVEQNSLESSTSYIPLMKQKSEKGDKPILPTSNLKLAKIDSHRTVKAASRKVSTGNMKYKKRKLFNYESTCDSHFNCSTSNVVNENPISIKIKESFSLNPKVKLLDVFKLKSKSSNSIENSPSIMMMEQDSLPSSPSTTMMELNSAESSSSLKMMLPNSMESLPPIIMELKPIESSTIMKEQNSVESATSMGMKGQKTKTVKKSALATPGLKFLKNNMRKIVKAAKRKVSVRNMEFKKKKFGNRVSSFNSQSNSSPSNVVNEDQISIKIKESFSLNSQSTPTVSSLANMELPLKKVSSTGSEGDNHINQSVNPLTVQGLIASIAFQTFFNIKPT